MPRVNARRAIGRTNRARLAYLAMRLSYSPSVRPLGLVLVRVRGDRWGRGRRLFAVVAKVDRRVDRLNR